MTQTVFLKIRPWEGTRPVECNLDLQRGDLVIAETEEGFYSGIVENVKSGSREKDLPGWWPTESTGLKIARKANLKDLRTIRGYQKKQEEALKVCREEVKKNELPMKVIGASYSLDGGTITFGFTAFLVTLTFWLAHRGRSIDVADFTEGRE